MPKKKTKRRNNQDRDTDAFPFTPANLNGVSWEPPTMDADVDVYRRTRRHADEANAAHMYTRRTIAIIPVFIHNHHLPTTASPVNYPTRICPDCASKMETARWKEEKGQDGVGEVRATFRHYFPNGERVLQDTLWLALGLLVFVVLVEVYL